MPIVGLIRRGSVASALCTIAGCGVNAFSGLPRPGGLLRRTPTLTPDAYLPYSSQITGVMALMQLLVQRPVGAVTIRPRFTAGRSPTSFAQRCTVYNFPHPETLRHHTRRLTPRAKPRPNRHIRNGVLIACNKLCCASCLSSTSSRRLASMVKG